MYLQEFKVKNIIIGSAYLLIFCPKCENRADSSNLFCENCGEKLNQNVISQFSPDEAIGGIVISQIKEKGEISYDQVLDYTKSKERTDRIFAQLERTGNFSIQQKEKIYYLIPIDNRTNQSNLINEESPVSRQIESKSTTINRTNTNQQSKLDHLKTLLEFGPILLENIAELMDVDQISAEQLVEKILTDYKFVVDSKAGMSLLTKKDY